MHHDNIHIGKLRLNGLFQGTGDVQSVFKVDGDQLFILGNRRKRKNLILCCT